MMVFARALGLGLATCGLMMMMMMMMMMISFGMCKLRIIIDKEELIERLMGRECKVK